MSDKPSNQESSNKENNEKEASDKKKVEFWNTLPGILTGVAGMITAIGALIVALSQAGLFSESNSASSPDTPQQSAQSEAIPANRTSGSFAVSARHSYEFTNPSDETKTILFKASGEWLAISTSEPPPNGYTSPQGYAAKACDSDCWCPQYVVGALVGSRDQDCFEIGEEGAVTLAGGQSILLYINDFQENYGDNEGLITVEWSFAK